MSYREKLVRVPKGQTLEYSQVKNYSVLESMVNPESEPDFIFTGLPKTQDLLYLGIEMPDNVEYVDSFFKWIDIKEESETRYQMINKEGLEHLIGLYDDAVFEMMESKLEYAKKNGSELLLSELSQKKDYWRNPFVKSSSYVLKKDDEDEFKSVDGQITNLPFLEHQIFNLVFIYNTFDWENNDLIVSGW